MIEKLRLTHEEIADSVGRSYNPHDFYPGERLIANAQLAKALWGARDEMLDDNSPYYDYDLGMDFGAWLDKIGVKRPE